MADIFVSYTSSDRGWAQWIGVELKEFGHNPFVRFGNNVSTEFTMAASALCVLTPAV